MNSHKKVRNTQSIAIRGVALEVQCGSHVLQSQAKRSDAPQIIQMIKSKTLSRVTLMRLKALPVFSKHVDHSWVLTGVCQETP